MARKLLTMIDYSIINSSILYYNRLGYNRVETPWLVPACIDDITRPKTATPYELVHNHKRLVASGEQSFLYQNLKGFLPKGKYQTVTPCFRDEKIDLIHCKYFIKNELIITDNVSDKSLDDIINDALSFFKKYLPESKVETTDIGFDIVCNGIELGSYGIRSCPFLDWVYGTGCAEPRTSSLINFLKL